MQELNNKKIAELCNFLRKGVKKIMLFDGDQPGTPMGGGDQGGMPAGGSDQPAGGTEGGAGDQGSTPPAGGTM